jgi:hypothetical protein
LSAINLLNSLNHDDNNIVIFHCRHIVTLSRVFGYITGKGRTILVLKRVSVAGNDGCIIDLN